MASADIGAAMTADLNAIKALKSIGECRAFYDSGAVQARMLRTYGALGSRGAEEWAREWAETKARGGALPRWVEEAEADRKVCLQLLYAMRNLCTSESSTEQALHAALIGAVFTHERVASLLGVFLPMDRANALYNMRAAGAAAPGVHWYAESHAAAHADVLRGYGGFATINKRLQWYVTALLGNNAAMARWLEPVFLPRLESTAAAARE